MQCIVQQVGAQLDRVLRGPSALVAQKGAAQLSRVRAAQKSACSVAQEVST